MIEMYLNKSVIPISGTLDRSLAVGYCSKRPAQSLRQHRTPETRIMNNDNGRFWSIN